MNVESEDKNARDVACIKVAVRVRPVIDAEEAKQEAVKPKRMTFAQSSNSNRGSQNPAISSQLQIQSEHESQQKHLVCVGETQVSINSATDTRNFVFDWVANPQATQEEVWKNVGLEVTQSTLQGFNGTIIAYGPTGSGKTHTIFGGVSSIQSDSNNKENVTRSSVNALRPPPPGASAGAVLNSSMAKTARAEQGLVPRALQYIWEYIYSEERRGMVAANANTDGVGASTSSSSSGRTIPEMKLYDVSVSMCEIYNERVYDLLNESSSISSIGNNVASTGSFAPGITGNSPLQLRDDPVRGIFVEHLTEEAVSSLQEAEKILAAGLKNRHVAATLMNRTSSRSHAVFLLRLDHTTEAAGVRTCRSSKFTLVDLAGSERQKSSGSSDLQLREAGQINRSLSELGNLIHSLTAASGIQHVQYRNSKLTYLLRDSLGGNSKTVMMAMITQSQNSIAETLTTLKFAQRAKKIKNIVRLNEQLVSGTVEALQREIAALKARIAESATLDEIHPHSGVHRSGGSDMATSTSPMPMQNPYVTKSLSAPLSAANYIKKTSSISPIITSPHTIAQRLYERDEPIRGLCHDIANADDLNSSIDMPSPVPRNLVSLPSAAHHVQTSSIRQQLQQSLERCLMADELRVRAEMRSRALQQQLNHSEKMLNEKNRVSESHDSPTITAITAIIRMEIEADLIKQRQIVQEMERRMKWTQAVQDMRHQANQRTSPVGQWVWQEQDENIFNHNLLRVIHNEHSLRAETDGAITSADVQQRLTDLEAVLQRERCDFERRLKDLTSKHASTTQALHDNILVLEMQKAQAESSANGEMKELLALKDTQYTQLMQQKRELGAEQIALQDIIEDIRANSIQLEEELAETQRGKEASLRVISDLKEHVAAAETALDSYQLQNKSLKEQNTSYMEAKQMLSDSLRAQESQVHELEQTNSRLSAENEWMVEEVDSLLLQSETVIGEKQRVKSLLASVEAELASVREDRDDLKVHFHDVQVALEQREGSELQLSALLGREEMERARVATLQDAINAAEGKYQALQAQFKAAKEEKLMAADKESSLRQMVSSLSDQLSKSFSSNDDLVSQVVTLTEAVSAAQTAAVKRKQSEEVEESQVVSLQATVHNLEVQLLNRAEKCEALRAAAESSEMQTHILTQEQCEMAAEMVEQGLQLSAAHTKIKELETALLEYSLQQKQQALSFQHWKLRNTPTKSVPSNTDECKTEATPTPPQNSTTSAAVQELMIESLALKHRQELDALRVELNAKHAEVLSKINLERNVGDVRKALIAEAAAKAARETILSKANSVLPLQAATPVEKPSSPFKSSTSVSSGVFDRVKPAFSNTRSLSMALFQRRNESKLDRLHRKEKNSSVISVGSDCSRASTLYSDCESPESISDTPIATPNSSACSAPCSAESVYDSVTSISSNTIEFNNSNLAIETPHSVESSETTQFNDSKLVLETPQSAAGNNLSAVSDGSESEFCSEKLNNLIPLIQNNARKFNEEGKTQANANSTPHGYSDPKLHETPVTVTRTYETDADDDDNEFDGVEFDLSPSSELSQDISRVTLTTPKQVGSLGWEMDFEHDMHVHSTKELAITDGEGRVYSRVHYNISLGGTEIGNGSNKHLLSQSLSSSPFLSKGEWKDTYWVLHTDKFCSKLNLYRSKSDYKFNPKSATGIIKTIVLMQYQDNTSADKENMLNNAPSRTKERNAKNSLYAKHIKSKLTKGRTVYSFSLCEMKAPGKAFGAKTADKIGQQQVQENPIVKFASTERAQVEALWQRIRHVCQPSK